MLKKGILLSVGEKLVTKREASQPAKQNYHSFFLLLVFVLLVLVVQEVNAQLCNNNNICDSGETRANCPNDCKMKMSYLTHIYDYSGGDPNCMTPLLSDFKSDLDEYIRNTPGNQRTKYVVFNMNGWDIESTATRPDGYKGTYRFKACPGGPTGCVVGTDWGGIYEDAIDYANSKGFTVVIMPPIWPWDIYDASGPPTTSCPSWSCPIAGSDMCSCVTTPDSVLEEEFYNWMLYLLNDRGYKNKNIVWHIGAEYDQFDYKGRWSNTLINYRLDNILSRDLNYITSVTNLVKKAKDAVAFVGSNQLVTTASAGIMGYLNPTYDPNTDDSIKQHLKFYGGADCTPTNLIGCNTGIGDVGVVDSVDIVGMDLFLPDASTTNTLVPFIQYMSSAFGKPLGIWQANIYGDLAIDPYEKQRTSIQLLMDKYVESVIDYVTVYEMRDQTWFDGNPDCNFIGCSYYCKGDFNIKCDYAPIGQPPTPPVNCPIASGDSSPMCVSYGCDDFEGIKYWNGKKKIAYDLYIDMFNKYGDIKTKPPTKHADQLRYDWTITSGPGSPGQPLLCPTGFSERGMFSPYAENDAQGNPVYTGVDYQGRLTKSGVHNFCGLDADAFLQIRYDYQTSTNYFCPAGYTDKGIFYPQSYPTQPTWTTAWSYNPTTGQTDATSSWAIMHLCSKNNDAFLNVRWDDYNKIGNSCPTGYYAVGAFKVPTQPQASGWYVGYGYDPITNSYPTDQNIESGWMQFCIKPNLPKYATFNGVTTNFAVEPDITSVTNAILEKTSYGKIEFGSQAIDFIGLDLDSYVTINNNLIGINEVDLPSLKNEDATLILYGLIFVNPVLLENGVACTHCSIISYTGGTLTFAVQHFSTFSAAETGDGDISQTACMGAGGTWANRGSQENCCGDDADEYYITGTDLSSACCSSTTATVENGRCVLKKSPGTAIGYDDRMIYRTSTGTTWTKYTTRGATIGARISDCYRFRSWMDFNIPDISDSSYIDNLKLTFTVQWSDNRENRYISIRGINNGAGMSANTLASEIANSNKEYTTYIAPYCLHTSGTICPGKTALDNKKTETLQLADAIGDLKNALTTDSFSLGYIMPDESCNVLTTYAFATFDSIDTTNPPYLTAYYNHCMDEDTDCNKCTNQNEKNAYANAWLQGSSWPWPVNPTTIMQIDVTNTLYSWVNNIGVCLMR